MAFNRSHRLFKVTSSILHSFGQPPLIRLTIRNNFPKYPTLYGYSTSSASPAERIPKTTFADRRLSLPPDTDYHIELGKRDIGVEIDGELIRYDSLFLRDICPCPQCVDPSTRQKLFNTTDIPDSVLPQSMRVQSNGKLEVIWNHPDQHPHKSFYDPELLYRYSSSETRQAYRSPAPKKVYWDGELMAEKITRTDYQEFLNDDATLHKVLLQLHLYGLTFFVNVPSANTDGTEIIKLARRFGEVKQTFYGTVWDVKSVAQSKNIAYEPPPPPRKQKIKKNEL